jgi:hypothetical protein
LPELFGDKKVIVDFINHLEQSDFVFLSLQKPIDELTREELDNALMLYIQLAEFWRKRYEESNERNEIQKRIIEEQEEIIDTQERKYNAYFENH